MGGKRFLFVFRKKDDTDLRFVEFYEMALTAAAFDHPVELLFVDCAVGLVTKQAAQVQDVATAAQGLLKSLALYDIRCVMVERESLTERGLREQDLVSIASVIDRARVADLVGAYDAVFIG